MNYKILVLVSLWLNKSKSVPIFIEEDIKCGYKACHPIKEGHINIHLVPHSHDDVGWVKTIDQYYYGVPVGNYVGAVQYIYQSVLSSLKRYSNRRFILVETAFFWKWWQLQDEKTQEDFTELVMRGQIEFTGGGWSMNDEAVVNYQSTIDQMTWGLRRLNDTFGGCGRPKMGWQIDPFGHSSEMASIFAQLGYDGVVLGRIDYQDKIRRIHNKSMDMVWRGSKSLGKNSDIFTSVLFNHYDAPDGFCYETSCNHVPLVDDPESPEYNIDKKAKQLLANYVSFAIGAYSTSNLLIPMGQDFAYQNAEMWFVNMDKLIKYINGREIYGKQYNIMYSTPACYAYAVHNETKGILYADLKTDDFFPYASDKNAYWTGYYTSRPQIKRFERSANNFLQVSKQLFALTALASEHEQHLNSFKEAMGVLQHHDGITGTEKMVVANDYEKILSEAMSNCENLTNAALNSLISKLHHPRFEHCPLTNISQCTISESSNKLMVTIYNPLSRYVHKYVRLPVSGTSYKVIDPSGSFVQAQIVPIHSKILQIPGRTSNATVELVFKAEFIPPLGFKSFYVQKKLGNDVTPLDNGTFCLHYEKIGFDVDPHQGFNGRVIFENTIVDLNQTFQYYFGAIDNIRPSGAYIFRRDPKLPLANVAEKVESNKLYIGPLISEVHQVINNMVSQTGRIYNDEKFVEFDWIVGSLPNYLLNGMEVITKYSTQLRTNSTFYTDSNGREMLKRIRNHRPTWNVIIEEPEPANYYPVTSKITLKDEEQNLQFTVLTDRAEGGASLEDGQIELMLHRNTALDDRLGVDEQLFDWAHRTGVVVRGSHYVVAGKIIPNSKDEENIVAIEREIAERKLLDAWTFISVPNQESFEDYLESNRMEFQGLQTLLPRNVHILTLEPWTDSNFLLRLEHVFAKNEDIELSQPATVNLIELFTTFQIISVRETTLGGNQWLDDNKRFKFKAAREPSEEYFRTKHFEEDEFEITLNPMQIRTFIVKTEPKLMFE